VLREGTDARLREQLRCERLGDRLDLAGELAPLNGQLRHTACDRAEREQSGAEFGVTTALRAHAGRRLSRLARVGVVTSRSRSWQSPARSAFTAPSRAVISGRSASRSPLLRGIGGSVVSTHLLAWPRPRGVLVLLRRDKDD